MKKAVLVFTLGLCAVARPCAAQQTADAGPWAVQSLTVAGGPILTRHFQSGRDNFVNHHEIGIVQADTADRGNWALYYLGPNSVGKQTFGAGYVTAPYVVPLGSFNLELSGALGLVSGYQDYPVPLLGLQARLDLYESGPWNVGAEVAAMPYIAKDQATNKNKFGVVGTTPFFSVRYGF